MVGESWQLSWRGGSKLPEALLTLHILQADAFSLLRSLCAIRDVKTSSNHFVFTYANADDFCHRVSSEELGVHIRSLGSRTFATDED